MLRATRRPLLESAASLDQQLAALSERLGSVSGAASNLPTAAQLQATWARLVTDLYSGGVSEGLPRAELAPFFEQAARTLLALQPDNPRSSYELGMAVGENATVAGTPMRRQEGLAHYQRGAELARAQGSDFWLARWSGC